MPRRIFRGDNPSALVANFASGNVDGDGKVCDAIIVPDTKFVKIQLLEIFLVYSESGRVSERSFVHLHCHSHYSLLDGAAPIGGLVEQAKHLGMNALALTDHGNLHGAVEFYQEAKKAGINPLKWRDAPLFTSSSGMHSAGI